MATRAITTQPQLRLRSLAFVAEYLDVSERTVRRYIAAGHLKAYRLGRGPTATIRLDLNDVENFVTLTDSIGAAS